MDGGGQEIVPGKGGVEEDYVNPQQGGGGTAGVRIIFKCCGTGGTALQFGYLVSHPPHGQGPGGGSGSGGKTTYRTAPAEDTKREVEIHLSGDGTVGSGGLGGGGIHQAFPEHSRTVHCYAITVRPV